MRGWQSNEVYRGNTSRVLLHQMPQLYLCHINYTFALFALGMNSKQKTPAKDNDWSAAFGTKPQPLPGIPGPKTGSKPAGYVPSFTMGSAKKQASESFTESFPQSCISVRLC